MVSSSLLKVKALTKRVVVYNFRLRLKVACSRRSDSGVRREGREREKNKEEKRERGSKTCEICFQKVIPPSLSASNPNVVSGVKSCQSTNGGRQTALFNTELKKYICLCIHLLYLFSANEYIPLNSKNERTGKHHSFHFLCR